MPVRRAGTQPPLALRPAPATPPRPRPARRVATLEPAAPRQLVTLDVPGQPLSSEDVYLTGTGPGWVDPAAAHASTKVGVYTGPLFRDEPSASDVQQGQLGDCYVCAALAGIAAADPEAIRRLIKPAGDGGAEVTFHERDVVTGEFRPVTIHVDTELYESASGNKPIYGHAMGDRASMELWFPLVEKAYATWRGGYDTVGKGGVQNQIFEAVLGRPAGWLAISERSKPDEVWGTMQATLKAGLPLGAATYNVDDGRYGNTGVHANHGYSVLGADEVNGERFVTLRNPWGSGEPRGDGVDDGVFRLKLSEFQKLYEQLQFTLL